MAWENIKENIKTSAEDRASYLWTEVT
jgi:hypothetical protein